MTPDRQESSSHSPPPSGWYIYPYQRGQKQRYWDGRGWKGKLRKRGFVASAKPFPRHGAAEAAVRKLPVVERPPVAQQSKPVAQSQSASRPERATMPSPPARQPVDQPSAPVSGSVSPPRAKPATSPPQAKPAAPASEAKPAPPQPQRKRSERKPVVSEAQAKPGVSEPPQPQPQPTSAQPKPVPPEAGPKPASAPPPRALPDPMEKGAKAHPLQAADRRVREGLEQGAAKREEVKARAIEELGYWNQRAGFLSHLHAEALGRVIAAEERCRADGVTDRQMQRRLEGLARPTEPFRRSDSPAVVEPDPKPEPPRNRHDEDTSLRATAATNGYEGEQTPDNAEPAPRPPRADEARPETPAAKPPSSGSAAPKAGPAPAATPVRASTPNPFEPAGPRARAGSGSAKRTQLFETVQSLRASARAARKRRANSRP